MYTKKAVVVMVLACLFFSGALFSCPNVILVKVDKEIMCVKSENQAIAAEYDWGDVNKDPKWRWILYYDSKEITRSKEYNGKDIKAFKIKPEYLVDSKGNYRTGEYEVMLEIYGIHVDENGKEREYGWHETIGEKKTFGSCNFWAVKVEITEAPEYLYADATAAVPVRIKIKGIDEVFIRKFNIHFSVDAALKVQYDAEEKDTFAKGEGFGVQSNGTSNKYTGWIPISNFKAIDLKEDTTEIASFKAIVRVSKTENGNPTGDCETDDYGIKVFGDRNVEIVEIGVKETFSPFKSSTRQDKMDIEEGMLEIPSIINYYHIAGTRHGNFPHLTHSKYDGTHYCFADRWVDVIHSNAKIKNKELISSCRLEDRNSVFFYGETVLARAYGLTLSCYFGVSYPRERVYVLRKSENPYGMNLLENSGEATMSWTGQLQYKMRIIKGSSLYLLSGSITAGTIKLIGYLAKYAICSTGWGAFVHIITDVVASYYKYQMKEEKNTLEEIKEPNADATMWAYFIRRDLNDNLDVFNKPSSEIHGVNTSGYTKFNPTTELLVKVGYTMRHLIKLDSTARITTTTGVAKAFSEVILRNSSGFDKKNAFRVLIRPYN